jgi:hypothetical protein
VACFSTLEKWLSTDHVLPRIPPQIHHDLPSRCTTKSSKPPAKLIFTTPNKKIEIPALKASDE